MLLIGRKGKVTLEEFEYKVVRLKNPIGSR